MFNWSEYLTLADEWANSEGEGNKRSAISRAYYSVFRKAHNYLIDCGALLKHEEALMIFKEKRKNKTNIGSHEVVWVSFSTLGKKGEKISTIGFRLKALRVQADYDNVFKGNIEKTTELTIQLARELEGILNS